MLFFTLSTVLVAFAEVKFAEQSSQPGQSFQPKQSSQPRSATHATHAAPPAEERVDINAATLEELMKVPGMTRTWAARIIRFRPYRVKNDLLDRGVLSGPVYDRIKDYVIAHRTKQ